MYQESEELARFVEEFYASRMQKTVDAGDVKPLSQTVSGQLAVIFEDKHVLYESQLSPQEQETKAHAEHMYEQLLDLITSPQEHAFVVSRHSKKPSLLRLDKSFAQDTIYTELSVMFDQSDDLFHVHLTQYPSNEFANILPEEKTHIQMTLFPDGKHKGSVYENGQWKSYGRSTREYNYPTAAFAVQKLAGVASYLQQK